MKKTLYILLFLFSLQLSAQNDTLTVLKKIRKAIYSPSLDTTLLLLDEAISKADELEFLEGRIRARRNLAPIQLKYGLQYEGLRTYLQLINILEKSSKTEELYEVYLDLSDYYRENNLPNNSAEYLKKSMAIAIDKELGYDAYDLFFTLGELYFEAANYEQALYNFYQSDSVAQFNGKIPLSIRAKRKTVKVYDKQKEYEKSLETNLIVLELLKKHGSEDEIAVQMNNVGFNYKKLNEIQKALKYFKQTLKLRENSGYTDKENYALLVNIAVTLQNLDRQGESLQYLKRAKAVVSVTDAPSLAVKIRDLISMAYLSQGSPYEALEENQQAYIIAGSNNLIYEKRDVLLTSSVIYEQLLEYDLALEAYKGYLRINDSIAINQKLREDQIIQQQIAVEKTEKEIQSLIATNDIKDYQLEQLKLESENKDIQIKNQQLEAKEKLQSLKIRQQELEKQNTEKELQTVKAKEENQRLLLKQRELEDDKRQKELQLLESKTKVQELEISQKEAANKSMLAISLLALVLMSIAFYAFVRIRKSNKVINFEKAKSEKLLLNILPESTAEELKTLGQSLPRQYQSVSILFTDFKGFTQITENMVPEQLVENLDSFFAGFDEIMNKYNIEKIKTIGDAYMCACGVPEPIEDHAHRIVSAAKEMITLANKINNTKRNLNQESWNLRIGINSGQVVAGVIGKNKFQYDIWGDAVNLAARMESSGEPNRINISESTYELIKEQFDCTYRGELEAKNKGLVKMYFVN